MRETATPDSFAWFGVQRRTRRRLSNQIHIKRNHDAPVRFTTRAHELGHLAVGHLGPDKISVPERPTLSHSQQELDAESVAYIVCERNGVAIEVTDLFV